MLPEILFYDPARAASFPENGRALTDDAVDAFLAILTKGKITGDKVGPHKDLLVEFPYLGPPHRVERSDASLFLQWNWAMFFPPDIAHLGFRRTRSPSAASPAASVSRARDAS
jgi:hypothetical protein